MVTSSINEPGLRDLLVSRARATSDGVLALTAGVGLISAVAIGVWQPPHWFLAECLAVCATAFGVFGVADRELADPTVRTAGSDAREATVIVLRAIASITGITAGAAFLFGVLGLLLGTWIS